ncbi:MAG: ABC transporter ATP-binding protein [Bacteroidia bacterium]|nr:ABC transporter ATP-binding protein/permease [Bacteroidia bacterium]MDW8159343.1 ABC transporter ATP-binding protein [Bacteroidia bacterium]
MQPKLLSSTKKNTFHRLLIFLLPYKKTFIIGLLLTFISSILNPIRPYWIQSIIDNEIAAGNTSALRISILGVAMLVILQAVLMYFQIVTTHTLGQNILNDMRNTVFEHILHLKVQYFDKTPIGILQTRTISDIQTLNNIFSEGLVTIGGEFLQLITILILMFITSWQLTLLVLAIIPLLVIAIYVFKKNVNEAFNRVRKYVAELNSYLQEHITGLTITQLFNKEKREAQNFDRINQLHQKAHIDTIYYYSIFFPVVEFMAALALAIVVWHGTQEVLQENITFGVLVAFLMYIQMFFRPIRMLADQFNALQLGIVSAERIFKVLDTQDFILDPQQPQNNPNLFHKPVSITFENVTFGYNPLHPVLKNISFHVCAGTTTAIVGATGSGKTTIFNLIKRFYEIEQGKILIDNLPVQSYTQAELHKAIGVVMQDVFLFSGSIYDNITLFNPHFSLSQVQKAAEIIGIHSFIMQLPQGYYFRVGERGATLSAGQRQLIAFVRILLYNPKIILLDEATANIDSQTEVLIQNALTQVLSHRTCIIIAHRLSTIQRADQIIVMRKGEIVESGKHDELLQKNGYYKKLFMYQYASFSPTY